MSKGGIVGSAQSGADKYRRRLLAAAGLSNNLLFSNLNTTITIKSSPPKNAEETARLGIISGFLIKRNEQHSWQRRFCTLVPHSLLYYFEDEEADAPRGIIDLEIMNNVEVLPNNVIRLAAAATTTASENGGQTEGSQQRTFYFQADSEEDMNAWMSALIRERYFVLRDERDAYQELQHDFQTQTDEMANVMRCLEAETKGMTELESRAMRQENELADQLSELLNSVVESSPPEEDTSKHTEDTRHSGAIRKEALETLAAAGGRLKQRVADLEQVLIESKKGAAAADRELKEYQSQVQNLTQAFDQEQKALAAEQRAKQQAREDVEALSRELDEAQVNLSIIERTRDTTETRVTELSEQKKLLVREVKAARKLLTEKQNLLLKKKKSVAAAHREQSQQQDDELIQESSHGSSSPPPNTTNRKGAFYAPSSLTPPTSNKQQHHTIKHNNIDDNDSASDLSTDDDTILSDSEAATVVPPLAMDWPRQETQKSSFLTGFGVRTFIEQNTPTLSPLIPSRKKKKTSLLSTEDEDRLVIRCRRCRGTVEGPKNSTCKCVIPLVGDQPDTEVPSTFITKSFGSFFGAGTTPPKAPVEQESATHQDTEDTDTQQASSEAEQKKTTALRLPSVETGSTPTDMIPPPNEEAVHSAEGGDHAEPPASSLKEQKDDTANDPTALLSPASSNATSSNGGGDLKNLVKL